MIRKQIACSIFGIVLSAGAAVTGTFAWFTSRTSVEASVSNITAVNPECYQLVEFNLYKFVYPTVRISETDSFIDYLAPENGTVNKYTYNEELKKFGTVEDDVFSESDVHMNLYDPLDKLINNSTLLSMNTNIIYEAKIKFLTADTRLKVDSLLRTVSTNENQIKASDCLEFDVFLDADLSSDSLIDGSVKKYYPSYKAQNDVLNQNEEIFHKFSYLSSLKNDEHCNFFETSEAITLYDDDCVLSDESEVTVFINVNYNAEKLADYVNVVRLEDLEVVDDYLFRFGYGV
ncbi:MAG: hypothetical protein MJ241_01495 [Bacilli bacterium]|nr:hypothetical protein [Bacilli bacterium]